MQTLRPPSRLHTLKELTAPFDWLHTLGKLRSLLRLPKGDGRPVLLVPGYLADDVSMWPLKKFLRKMEYQSHYWELGRNRGNVETDIVRLGEKIISLYAANGQQKITLIGWSLGGVLSREVTRLFPNEVREVITLGTPISGGPKYTALAKRYSKRKNLDLDSTERKVLARNTLGISQPVTSIIANQMASLAGKHPSISITNKQKILKSKALI